MATEKDLEWLDDYLSNRMEESDKALFEERLKTDASLRSEMAIQKALVESLKKARAADLKSMLSQIPVAGSGMSSGLGKTAAWIAVAAAIGTGAFFYFTTEEVPVEVVQQEQIIEEPSESGPVEIPAAEDDAVDENTLNEEEAASSTDDRATESPAAQSPAKSRETTPERKAPVTQPALTPFDPTKELESATEKPQVDDILSGAVSSESSIQVETDDSNKKYSFHYRFEDGKLYLMGSFEKDLYEIMEFFNNSKKTVFLYYNDNYYLLDENQSEPAPLRSISDPNLLNRLREYRK